MSITSFPRSQHGRRFQKTTRHYASEGSALIFGEDFLSGTEPDFFDRASHFGVGSTSAFARDAGGHDPSAPAPSWFRQWGRSNADAGIMAAVGLYQTGCPALSIDRRGTRILEVGLMAMVTTTSWPVEIPPRMPPA